jgi:GNAT superfamily N-acetyltransferase
VSHAEKTFAGPDFAVSCPTRVSNAGDRAMSATIRPARAEELQAVEALVVRSINDLTERHGFGPIASLRTADFQLFSLQDDPDGLWVAEDAGEILGFAFSWACDRFWFLAELFVSPDRQGSGIGDALLRRTFEHADKVGADNRALITFSFNTVSQGLYVRHGLYPRLPLYFVKVSRDVLVDRLGNTEELRCIDAENTDLHRQRLVQLDSDTLGFSRDKHHRFLLSDPAMRGVLLHAGDDCVGYAYVNSSGQIGPVSVARPGVMAAAFRAALRLAAQSGASGISAFLPGSNAAALDVATAHGMRITFPMMLVSAREFGDWTRYLPRNPGLM